MFTLIVVIHVLVCLIIIGMVLLQAGKGADIGSAFGGSGSQAVFGSMGTPTLAGLSHHRSTTIMPASAPAGTSTPAVPATPAAPAPEKK